MDTIPKIPYPRSCTCQGQPHNVVKIAANKAAAQIHLDSQCTLALQKDFYHALMPYLAAAILLPARRQIYLSMRPYIGRRSKELGTQRPISEALMIAVDMDLMRSAFLAGIAKNAAEKFSRKFHWVKGKPDKASERVPSLGPKIDPAEKTIIPGTPRSEVFARQLRREAARQGLKIDFPPLPKKPGFMSRAAAALMRGLRETGRRASESVEHLYTGIHPEIRRMQEVRGPVVAEKSGKTTTRTLYPDVERTGLTKRLIPSEHQKFHLSIEDLLKDVKERKSPEKTSFPSIELQKKAFFDGFNKIAAEKTRKMPHFTEQDRPEGVKKIYRALAHRSEKAEEMRRRYGKNWKEVAARIAARQGKPGKQKQGPPYKGPLGGIP